MENTTCTIDGCANQRTKVLSGWCSTHYQNHQRTGDPMKRNLPKVCEICELQYTPYRSNQKYCSGACSRKAENSKLCSTEDCFGKVRWGGKCKNHGRQAHRAKVTREGICKHCGETVQFTSTRTIYCSRSCASKDMHKTGKGGKRPSSELGQAYVDGNPEEFKSALLDRCEIDASGCWLWAGTLNTSGYANIYAGGKNHMAHRISYETLTGDRLGAMDAHHICGVAKCLNPEHIQPATRAANIGEMKARRSYEARIAELEAQVLQLASNKPS